MVMRCEWYGFGGHLVVGRGRRYVRVDPFGPRDADPIPEARIVPRGRRGRLRTKVARDCR